MFESIKNFSMLESVGGFIPKKLDQYMTKQVEWY